ncbi:MAG: HAD family hydrolase [Planctomycetes bacterium]|nr:HAD family hydrolase [Planctomycetota bacterium]
MPQFGAGTIISGEAKLILLDCFETLVSLEGSQYRARNGVAAFLDHFAGKADLVVVSDAEEETVVKALDQAGLQSRIKRIYHAGNAIVRDGAGRIRKRLDVPLTDFKVQPHQAVFIGDSPLDAEAARRYMVPFIRVPRSEDRSFTFSRLIAGPSRYDSSEFSAQFLEQYIGERKPPTTAADATARDAAKTPEPAKFITPVTDKPDPKATKRSDSVRKPAIGKTAKTTKPADGNTTKPPTPADAKPRKPAPPADGSKPSDRLDALEPKPKKKP